MGLNEKLADIINNATYTDIYDRMHNLALAMFKYNNLPPSVSARFIEEALYDYGRAVFVEDKKLGFLGLRVTPADSMNFYREFLKYNAWSIGYNEIYDKDDCVLIRNNYLMTPTSKTVELFAYRVYDAQRTIDINMAAQKTPWIVACDESKKLTLMKAYENVKDNCPVIFTYKGFNKDELQVFNVNAPFIADKAQEVKRNAWNDFMLFLGIKPLADQKRERMITAEAESDMEQVIMGAQVMLLTRQEACEQINKKYGLNISVELRKELAMMAFKESNLDLEHKYDEPPKQEGGEQNG